MKREPLPVSKTPSILAFLSEPSYRKGNKE